MSVNKNLVSDCQLKFGIQLDIDKEENLKMRENIY